VCLTLHNPHSNQPETADPQSWALPLDRSQAPATFLAACFRPVPRARTRGDCSSGNQPAACVTPAARARGPSSIGHWRTRPSHGLTRDGRGNSYTGTVYMRTDRSNKSPRPHNCGVYEFPTDGDTFRLLAPYRDVPLRHCY
jgi:hypothetical protein